MKHLVHLTAVLCAALLIVACGDGSDDFGSGSGVRIVDVEGGAEIVQNAPEDLVVLDVRSPEEFGEGHLDGAMMIDFYAPDFAERIAALDPDVPYLLYCRSGNRSGQTASIMRDLGFADVADVAGGILAWTEAGNEVVIP